MNTCFTTEPMIGAILNTGLDVIDMVKQLKQHYIYNGKQYKLPKLKKFGNCSAGMRIYCVCRKKT